MPSFSYTRSTRVGGYQSTITNVRQHYQGRHYYVRLTSIVDPRELSSLDIAPSFSS